MTTTTSTTDSALAWLLSLDAICTTSPFPVPTSPDLTDWLHISPRTESPASAHQNEPVTSSPFLQDVTSSSRVNIPQERDFTLNYLYDLSDLSDANVTDGISSWSLAPGIFNLHHRMISLESTSQTLINTPSPLRSPAFFFPSGSAGLPPEDRTTNVLSPLIASPGSKSFLNYFRDLSPSTPSAPTISMSDISPVVRANDLERATAMPSKKLKKKRKTRRHKPALQPSSFVEKLQALPQHSDTLKLTQQGLHDVPSVPNASSVQSTLLSPCRLQPDHIWTHSERDSGVDDSLLGQVIAQDLPSQPNVTSIGSLSPLTPLPSSSESPIPPLKITLKLKRSVLENPTVTPLRRSKRPRKTYFPPESPLSSASLTLSRHSSPEPKSLENLSSVHTVRTFPASIQISKNFPLFYRRFPASAYYRLNDTEPSRFLSDVSQPGGLYNPPRYALDLYTPRFVRGKGVEKVGLCPICIEPPIRGGENKKLWFAMKFSAFKYVRIVFEYFLFLNPPLLSYHMQYAHGISASTGRPFSPPVEFRTVVRQNPGKKEKHTIQQGKCHKCAKWVAVEGIKDMESKVKELHWWKHAAACHQDSTLEGEGDLYEEDDILASILSLKPVDVVV